MTYKHTWRNIHPNISGDSKKQIPAEIVVFTLLGANMLKIKPGSITLIFVIILLHRFISTVLILIINDFNE